MLNATLGIKHCLDTATYRHPSATFTGRVSQLAKQEDPIPTPRILSGESDFALTLRQQKMPTRLGPEQVTSWRERWSKRAVEQVTPCKTLN